MTPTYTAVGDIGIDMYPQTKKQYPGGMALNNAIHAVQAGARASIISAVGSDDIGNIAMKFLKDKNVNKEHVTKIIGGRTQSIDVMLDKHKVQHYGDWDLGVLADFVPTKKHEAFLATQDASISFYLPEFAHFFNVYAGMKLDNSIKIADFTDLSEHDGDVQFINQYQGMFNWYVLSIERVGRKARKEQFSQLVLDHKVSGIALLGSDGSMVIYDGKIYHELAKRVKVVDTTGAGDSYVGTFFAVYLRTCHIPTAMKSATKRASEIIQRFGAL